MDCVVASLHVVVGAHGLGALQWLGGGGFVTCWGRRIIVGLRWAVGASNESTCNAWCESGGGGRVAGSGVGGGGSGGGAVGEPGAGGAGRARDCQGAGLQHCRDLTWIAR